MESIRELRKICQPYSLKEELKFGLRNYIARLFSIFLTKIFLIFRMTGNQVTMLSILTGVIAGVFFLKGVYLYSLIGALIFQLSWLLDYSDGEVARYRKQVSVGGEYLDLFNHHITQTFLLFCIGFGLYSVNGKLFYLIFGFLASISILYITMVRTEKYKLFILKAAKGEKKLLNNFIKEAKKDERKITGRRILQLFLPLNLVLIGALFNILNFIIIFYGICLPLFWFWGVYKEFKVLKLK